MKNEQPKFVDAGTKSCVFEPQSIKSNERAKRLPIPPVYCLRGIRAYGELRIVVTEVGQVKQKVTSRYRPGVAQRVGRGIALLFHERGTRRG